MIVEVDDLAAELCRRAHLGRHLRGPGVVEVGLLVVEQSSGSEGVVERDHVIATLRVDVRVGVGQACKSKNSFFEVLGLPLASTGANPSKIYKEYYKCFYKCYSAVYS